MSHSTSDLLLLLSASYTRPHSNQWIYRGSQSTWQVCSEQRLKRQGLISSSPPLLLSTMYTWTRTCGKRYVKGKEINSKNRTREGTKSMILQIVYNLLSNAIKYTLKGSVHVSLASQGDAVVLSVSDSGNPFHF